MSLGQRSYLESKGRGDHSMNEKRMTPEGVYDVDPQGPRVMVKAGLLEPQCSDGAVHARGYNTCRPLVIPYLSLVVARNGRCRPAGTCRGMERRSMRPIKSMSGAPKTRYDRQKRRTTGLPTGHEPYGNRVPIVVTQRAMPRRGRVLRPAASEGEQVTAMTRTDRGARDA